MKLHPINPDDARLRVPCREVNPSELRTKAIQSKIEDLLDYVFMNNHKGLPSNKHKLATVGLSANQVGINLAICIVDLGIGHKSYNDIHVLVNPKITWKSKTLIKRYEGCVNLKNVMGAVQRSARVKLEAYDRSGNKLLLDAKGWSAILLQHEVGHLNGELFIDLLEDPKAAHLVKPEQIKDYRKNKQNWTKFIDVSGLVNNKGKT